MICKNCNSENNYNNLYCHNCGSDLKQSENVENRVVTNNNSKNANVSLTCGIICLVMAFIFNILCFIPGIISIVYAVKYKKESGKLGVGFGLSLGGMIYSFVIFIISILFVLMFISVANSTVENYDYYDDYEYYDDYYDDYDDYDDYYDDYNSDYSYDLSDL